MSTVSSGNRLILKIISPPPQIKLCYDETTFIYKVYSHIFAYGPLTKNELAEDLKVNKKELSYPLRRLSELNLLKITKTHFEDMRMANYSSVPDEELRRVQL